MNEIELKAHVYDRETLIRQLNSFAVFNSRVIRDDVYYAHPDRPDLKIRFRKETRNDSVTWLVTYKKKENHTGENGIPIEVNDEKECNADSVDPLISFFEDSGYIVHLKKHKDVMDWNYNGATLELCKVEGLGDFLEIEILAESDEKEVIHEANCSLLSILDKAGISRDCIETKYYSQLLREKSEEKSGGKNV